MRFATLFLMLLIVFSPWWRTSRADEPEGVVDEVKGSELTIKPDFRSLPRVGDKIEIIAIFPEIGEARVATAVVTSVDDERVHARIEKATGKVQRGHLVRAVATKPPRGVGGKRNPPMEPDESPILPPDEEPVLPPDDAAPIESEPPAAAAGPTPQMRHILKAAIPLIKDIHYSRHPLDGEIARRTLANYLHTVDPQKMFLRRSDVDRFRRRVLRLKDDLAAGDVTLAFDIYLTFRDRAAESRRLVGRWIQADHDFTVREQIVIDMGTAEYVATDEEASDRWRRRIKYDLLVLKADSKSLDEARQTLVERYGAYRRQPRGSEPEDVFNAFMKSLAAAYDAKSTYLSQTDFKNQQISIASEVVGIGASLQVVDDFVTVQRLTPGGPAALDGTLQPGDRITAVGQGESGKMIDVHGQRLAEVVSMIRGPKDTKVRLRILPEGRFESSHLTLLRDKIDLARMGTAVLGPEDLPGRRKASVGYVYLPAFYMDIAAKQRGEADYRSTSCDLRPMLDKFREQDVDVVLLDLRKNTGGSLVETIDTAGLFVGSGPILQVRGGDGKTQAYSAIGASVAWDGPLVVVTSRYTAGGGEILAGVLRDYRRGLLIGDPKTFGSGGVRDMVDIGQTLFGDNNPPRLGHLVLSIQKFYLPGGWGIQQEGLAPHVVLPSRTSEPMYRTSAENYELEHDSINPVAFQTLDYPIDDAMRQELAAASQRRRADSSWFTALDEWLKSIRAKRQATHQTLHEATFKAQRLTDFDAENEWPAVAGVPDVKLDPYLAEVLAVSLDYVGRVHCEKAEELYAARKFRSALDILRRAVEADPTATGSRYQLAWCLATCPEESLRDGEEAARVAKCLCDDHGWKEWTYVFALALAEAEAKRFDDASRHLREALKMAPEDSRAQYEYLEDRFRRRQAY